MKLRPSEAADLETAAGVSGFALGLPTPNLAEEVDAARLVDVFVRIDPEEVQGTICLDRHLRNVAELRATKAKRTE
jgi:hypothetical protein